MHGSYSIVPHFSSIVEMVTETLMGLSFRYLKDGAQQAFPF